MFIAGSVFGKPLANRVALFYLGNGKAVTFQQFCERTTLTADPHSDLLPGFCS
jgi:hypothetical protein